MRNNLMLFLSRKMFSMGHVGLFNWMTDELYLKILFYAFMGEKLDLKNPRTFNQKLQWLKLYDRRVEYVQMVDKYAVKEYIADKIGEKYLIPTLGVWDSYEQIDFNELPKQFVLKCTHDSGGLVICKDKSKFDYEYAKKKIKKSLRMNYYYAGREWPYRDVPPRIIAEEYMCDDCSTSDELTDYKVLCFDGEPKLIEVHHGRFNGFHTQDIYNINWEKTNFEQPDDPLSNEVMGKPAFSDDMLRLTRVLAEGIPHVRVDWYYTRGRLYFGEITFYDGSGFVPFIENQDEIIGDWIRLPEESYEKNKRCGQHPSENVKQRLI